MKYELAFPIHGLGICPKPGAKKVYEPNGQAVQPRDGQYWRYRLWRITTELR